MPPSLNFFLAPLNRWSKGTRIAAALLALLVTGAFAIAMVMPGNGMFTMADTGWYLQLALGNVHKVRQPFASRQLGPAVVRLLMGLLHWPLKRAFLAEGLAAFFVTLLTVYWLLMRSASPRWMLPALMFLPFWPQAFAGLVLPDLWYAGLLSIFLLLLWRRRLLAAACMMFPLMVSRESTSLTLACLLIACWRPLRWTGRLLAVGAAVAGTLLVQHLAAGSPGNIEHLPQSIYMVAKVPWNFLRNFLGVRPWSNIDHTLCRVPAWQHGFRAGPVSAIGACGFDFVPPVATLAAALTTFGLLPLLTVFVWVRLWRAGGGRNLTGSGGRKLLLRFSLLYGAASLLLAPLLGTWASRLFGYGWPFCLIALPLLFDDFSRRYGEALFSRRAAIAVPIFLGLHLADCLLIGLRLGGNLQVVAVAPYLLGYGLLRWWFGAPVSAAGKRLPSNPQAGPEAV